MTSLNPIGYDIIGATQARMKITGGHNEDGSSRPGQPEGGAIRVATGPEYWTRRLV